MPSKLTLLIDNDVISFAKKYAQSHGVSLSKMIEQYFGYISEKDEIDEKIPPITDALTGIAKFETDKTDRELLTDALNKKAHYPQH